MLIFILLPLLLSGCSKSSDSSGKGSTVSSVNFSVAVPQALQELSANGELTAQVIVAGVRTDLRIEDNKVKGSIGNIPAGKQNFVIEYFLDDVLVARAATEAELIANSNISISFPLESLSLIGSNWNEMNWNASSWS